MIALYIILAVVCVLALILFIDISVTVLWNKDLDLKVKVFMFPLNLEKILTKSAEDKPNKEALDTAKKKKRRKKSAEEILNLISYIFRLISLSFAEFKRYARITISRLKISVSASSPDETAMLYGTVSSALYTLVELLSSSFNVKRNYKSIGVVSDFLSEECKLDLKVIIKLKPIHLILALVHVMSGLAQKKGKRL